MLFKFFYIYFLYFSNSKDIFYIFRAEASWMNEMSSAYFTDGRIELTHYGAAAWKITEYLFSEQHCITLKKRLNCRFGLVKLAQQPSLHVKES